MIILAISNKASSKISPISGDGTDSQKNQWTPEVVLDMNSLVGNIQGYQIFNGIECLRIQRLERRAEDKQKKKLNRALLEAAKCSDVAAMDQALEKGARPGGEAYDGVPLIYTICIEGLHKAAIYLIRKFPYCVRTKTENGLTPLYAAVCSVADLRTKIYAKTDDSLALELIDLILRSSENIDADIGFKEGTILHSFLSHDRINLPILKTLLKYKPNPFIRNCMNQTPLEYFHYMSYPWSISWNEEQKGIFNIIVQILSNYELEYRNAQKITQVQVLERQAIEWERWKKEYNELHSKAECNGYGPGAVIPYQPPVLLNFPNSKEKDYRNSSIVGDHVRLQKTL